MPSRRLIFVAVFLLSISFLIIVQVPLGFLLIPTLLATEGGHYLAILCLFLSFFPDRSKAVGRFSFAFFWIAAGIFLIPLLQARSVAVQLQAGLDRAFGVAVSRRSVAASSRQSPLSLIDLFVGIRSPAVRRMTLSYASASGQPLSMDLYQPVQQTETLPAILVVHGGSWQRGDRGEFAALNRYLAARGYLVAAIDYRLSPQWRFPAARDDVFEAIEYLKTHATEIGWDAQKLVLIGRSAGGQIALSCAYAQREPVICGVVSFYAPNDLVFGYSRPSPPLVLNSRQLIEDYLGGPPGYQVGLYEAASPINFVNHWTPPTLMIHGERDEMVSPLHEVRLAQRLEAVRRPHYYLRLPWATHGCDVYLGSPSGQLSTFAIERFLLSVMPTPSDA